MVWYFYTMFISIRRIWKYNLSRVSHTKFEAENQKVKGGPAFLRATENRIFGPKKLVFRPIMAAKWKILKTDKLFSVNTRFRSPVQNLSFRHFHFLNFFLLARKLFLPPGSFSEKKIRPLYPLCSHSLRVTRPCQISGPNDKRWYQKNFWKVANFEILIVLV